MGQPEEQAQKQAHEHGQDHCALCESAGGVLIWQNDRCRVVRVADREGADYPGFCRVIWRAHVREMTDLPPLDRQHLMQVVLAVETTVRALYRPDKINLASLGNLTPHLHWHVIPRRHDDPHFPAPIWAAPCRESAPSSPIVSVTALHDRLSLELARMWKE